MAADDLTLEDLIRRTKKVNDLTYDDLGKASGGTPGAKRYEQISNYGLRNFPDPPSIVGMAQALNVPVGKVINAAARSLGLDPGSEESAFMAMMPAHTDVLDEDDMKLLIPLIRQLINAKLQKEEPAVRAIKKRA